MPLVQKLVTSSKPRLQLTVCTNILSFNKCTVVMNDATLGGTCKGYARVLCYLCNFAKPKIIQK